ncbi:hypothetical protein N8463_02270 [Synechococcus sp. AH-601-P06]|nr:hypothetical protein [Synechococcus sp. AH-601-O20]MDA7437426.1 hypothetical protein [Synechococcus sp. AH-601-P06]
MAFASSCSFAGQRDVDDAWFCWFEVNTVDGLKGMGCQCSIV